MKYRLVGSNDTNCIVKTILNNRGVLDWRNYISLNKANRNKYNLLCNIDNAVELFDRHFKGGDLIGILVDTDT